MSDFSVLNFNVFILIKHLGIHGEHTESEDGIFEISNKRRLGFSEAEAVKDMGFGVSEIMKMEREAEVFKTKSCHVL